MRERLEQRRAELAAEHERGTSMLQQLDRDRETLAKTLLRINGAVQVLDELLAAEGDAAEGVEDGDNS